MYQQSASRDEKIRSLNIGLITHDYRKPQIVCEENLPEAGKFSGGYNCDKESDQFHN